MMRQPVLERIVMAHPVVLFDGECNLCNWSVQFIIARDPVALFRFASIQSPAGTALLIDHDFDPTALDGFVLVEDAQAYTGTDAALRVVRHLGSGWRLLGVFRLVPRGLRDFVYRFVANNRYRWFGRRDSCMVPTPDLRRRFL